MILPTYRFLFWFTLLATPAALAPIVWPHLLAPALLLPLLFLLFSVFDAIRSTTRLDPVRITSLPVTRLSKDRMGSFDLLVWQEISKPLSIRLGIAWPLEIYSEFESRDVAVPEAGKQLRLHW